MPKSSHRATIYLDLEMFQEAPSRWVARWAQLHLSTHGQTGDEAVKNLLEMIRLFFDSCRKRGTLARVLSTAHLLPNSGTNETIYDIVIRPPNKTSYAGPLSAVA